MSMQWNHDLCWNDPEPQDDRDILTDDDTAEIDADELRRAFADAADEVGEWPGLTDDEIAELQAGFPRDDSDGYTDDELSDMEASYLRSAA